MSALKRALAMPLAKRRERHWPMLAHLLENDTRKWAEDYLAVLAKALPRASKATTAEQARLVHRSRA